MFGIGMPELAVILVVALIVLGPKRLPEVARQIGKAMAELRRQSNEIVGEFERAARVEEEADRRREREARRTKNRAAAPADTAPAGSTPPAGSTAAGDATEPPGAAGHPGADPVDPSASGTA